MVNLRVIRFSGVEDRTNGYFSANFPGYNETISPYGLKRSPEQIAESALLKRRIRTREERESEILTRGREKLEQNSSDIEILPEITRELIEICDENQRDIYHIVMREISAYFSRVLTEVYGLPNENVTKTNKFKVFLRGRIHQRLVKKAVLQEEPNLVDRMLVRYSLSLHENLQRQCA
ncbi:hypothetical protein J4405_00110 [Candidatus Woesearchaeota archaeon]|nr:hypothetical protein [Candidatus Woesearchaeota archaeon]